MSSTYLARFSDFQSDPTDSLLANFRRLAIQEGWGKKGDTYKEEKKEFLAGGVVVGFLDTFGRNDKSLQAWQSLCKTIGVPETKEGEGPLLLTSITVCQNVCRCYSATFSIC